MKKKLKRSLLVLALASSSSAFAVDLSDFQRTWNWMRELGFNNCVENPTAAARLVSCLPNTSPRDRAALMDRMYEEFTKYAGYTRSCEATPVAAILVCKKGARQYHGMVEAFTKVWESMRAAGFEDNIGNMKAAAELVK